MEQISLFINPVAGRGRAGKLAPLIVGKFAENNIKAHLVASNAVGDLERRVREVASGGAQKIVIAGGDGSVHEAVNGLISSGSDTALGIIPVGTGNDFAKAIDMPLDWREASDQLIERIRNNSPVRPVDAGVMNDRYFANGVGIGFDAKINRIARKYNWPIGDLVYLLAVFEGLWDGVITPHMKLRCTELSLDGPITLANISNGPWVGGLFHIAPMASVNDGLLDLIIAAPMSRMRILRLLPKLLRGKHIGAPGIRDLRTKAVNLTSDEPVPNHLDGESQPLQKEFEIRILQNALSIL